MLKKRTLINALKSGSAVKVVYKFGSQPNHAREIIPINIEKNEVSAICLNSNTKKRFYIKKLKLLNSRQYDKHVKWDPNFGTITDFEIYEIRKKERNKMFRFYSVFFVSTLLSILLIIVVLSSLKK